MRGNTRRSCWPSNGVPLDEVEKMGASFYPALSHDRVSNRLGDAGSCRILVLAVGNADSILPTQARAFAGPLCHGRGARRSSSIGRDDGARGWE